MGSSQKNKNERNPARLNFHEESRFKWLPMLLDAYAIIDEGVSEAIKNKERCGVKLACKKDCGSCCHTHKDIPVYPLELVGIYWYVIEKITAPKREILKTQLAGHTGSSCPFLVGSSCSVHPVRPVSCRQFNVFNKPCAEGEDPYYTRRDDVLTPIEDYTNRAFSIMLPFYGVTDKAYKAYIIKNNLIHTQVQILQSLNWKELAKKM